MIYIVLKNADFTEGRGPMMFHSVWRHGEEAILWVSRQPGIYGSAQKVERGKYGKYAYANGYEIIESPLIESFDDYDAAQEELERAKALGKLTERERKLLGLEG